MVSAMEAQDTVAAQRLLDTAQQNNADTGVLGEIVTHTQRMIQTLNQEEAALFASLRVRARQPTLPQTKSRRSVFPTLTSVRATCRHCSSARARMGAP